MSNSPASEGNDSPSPETQALKNLAAEKAGALNPTDTVEMAGERLRSNQANRWPVVEDRKLVGMIEEENPDWKIGGSGHDPKDWKVGEIMSRDVLFCYEDEDCAAARKLMRERDLRYLPVVDRQMRIVGIFSREEIKEQIERMADASSGEEL